MKQNINMYEGDLSDYDISLILEKNKFVTIDTETTGLDPINDSLCLIQIYDGEKIYLLKYSKQKSYKNLSLLMESCDVKKIFHHGNFDLRFLIKNLELTKINNVGCTKISAKLLNGKDESSSLKYLVNKYLGIEMNKEMQTSDWSKDELSLEQLQYACNDVIYLYKLWKIIKVLMQENNIYNTAEKCFDYLPTNAMLHNRGIENIFIY